MTHRHSGSADTKSELRARFLIFFGTLIGIAVAMVVLSFAQPAPFKSAEVAFTDASAHGMQIVPASCPSNPNDADAPYGCSSISGTPLCPNGITPAPNRDVSQCTCAESNTCSGTPPGTGGTPGGNPGGNPGGGITENGNPVSSCDIGYTQVGNICNFTGCPTGYVRGTDSKGNPTCSFAGCPSGFTQKVVNSQLMCIQNACIQGYVCGANGNLYLEDSSCNETLAQTCSYGCVSNACFFPPPNSDIIAVPSIVKSGETTKVSWKAQYVQSCNISGTNGDAWRCSGNACAATTTTPSSNITAQTTYVLSCTGLDGSHTTRGVTVNIVPNFVEH